MTRWGILGVAKINERSIPAFLKAKDTELRALASRDLGKAQAAASAAGIPVAHGSYEALLDDPSVDAVYIPLPNHLHGEWTRMAADRGKHVLCEKPLTPTASDAQALVEYCAAKKVRLMDGFMWPHHPRTAHLRRFLDDGGIGEIRHITGAFTFLMEPLDRSNIRLQPEAGGGSLLDVGCYPVYGIRWAFAAEPVAAWATATMANGVDVAMAGVLRFADGRTGSFDCGFTTPLRGGLEIAGRRGTVRVPEMWLPATRATYHIEREGRSPEVVTVEGEDQIVHMLQNFGRAVREGREPTPPPVEGVKTLRVLDALAASAREGREVRV